MRVLHAQSKSERRKMRWNKSNGVCAYLKWSTLCTIALVFNTIHMYIDIVYIQRNKIKNPHEMKLSSNGWAQKRNRQWRHGWEGVERDSYQVCMQIICVQFTQLLQLVLLRRIALLCHEMRRWINQRKHATKYSTFEHTRTQRMRDGKRNVQHFSSASLWQCSTC